jgi:hypothetical protein
MIIDCTGAANPARAIGWPLKGNPGHRFRERYLINSDNTRRFLIGLTFGGENSVGDNMLQKSDDVKLPRLASRPYQKPTLVKGPVLTTVTAKLRSVSGL